MILNNTKFCMKLVLHRSVLRNCHGRDKKKHMTCKVQKTAFLLKNSHAIPLRNVGLHVVANNPTFIKHKLHLLVPCLLRAATCRKHISRFHTRE